MRISWPGDPGNYNPPPKVTPSTPTLHKFLCKLKWVFIIDKSQLASGRRVTRVAGSLSWWGGVTLGTGPMFLHVNPFTPESDQCQNSPAASQEIWHHTVWRTWLFIAYSDEKWLYYELSLHHSYNRFLKGWENTLFELRSERVNTFDLGKRSNSKYTIHILHALFNAGHTFLTLFPAIMEMVIYIQYIHILDFAYKTSPSLPCTGFCPARLGRSPVKLL